jgi:predicted Zn finger-like uncharacterized protein
MIVKCEKCESEFSLNEGLLKKDGSNVRCSVCRNIFKVFPPQPEPLQPEQESFEGFDEDDFSITALEETVALDLPPDLEDMESEAIEADKGNSFEKAFENAMEEVIDNEDYLSSEDEPVITREKATTGFLTEETDGDDIEPSEKGKTRPRLLLIILSAVLLLIALFLVIFFFFPGVLPDSLYSKPAATRESVADAGVTQLNLKSVTGSFSSSDKAGQLFIINGTVVNNDRKSRSFILLKGGILDKEGKPIKEETAYAGNIITEALLKQMSKEDIKTAMKNRTGSGDNNVDVQPGASVPFMIVFTDLPEKTKMVDLTAEPVSSSTGK